MAKSSTTTLVGLSLTLKDGEKVRVSEPPAEIILEILEDCPQILGRVANISLDSDDPTTSLMKVAFSKDLRDGLFRLVSSSIDQDEEYVRKLGMTDLMKILVKIKEVFDWEDLKETFFQLVPPQILSRMKGSLEKMETPTSTTP